MEQARLFEHMGTPLAVADFKAAFKGVGITEGDIVFVHAGLQAFGKPVPGLTKDGLSRSIVGALEDAVGKNGTLVMPTFTYAFCTRGSFDLQKSPSEVGMLTEYFRRQKGVVRSHHPIFSVAASGKDAKKLTDVDLDSFGPKSFFAHLRARRGKVLFLGGATFYNSCTFIHYIEQQHRVPYRFMKKFPGTMVDGKKRTRVVALYYVRPLEGDVINGNSKLERVLKRKRVIREMKLGAALVRVVPAHDLYHEGMKMLDKDPYSLLDHKPRV